MNHDVRSRQIQARSTRLERNQEHRDVAAVKLLDQRHALNLIRFARQLERLQARVVQCFLQQRKHRGELRKDQHVVPLGCQPARQLDQLVELAASGRIFFQTEPRIAAELPQPRQPRQQLHASLRVGQLAFRLLHQLFGVSVVDFGLPRRHLAGHHGFNFLRQIVQHVLLHAPQNERRDHQMQVLARLLVRILHNRRFKPFAEALISMQIARHQEIKNRPEFAESIFNRRARERKAMRRLQRFDRLGRL